MPTVGDMTEGLRVRVLGGCSLEVDGRPVDPGWRLRKAEALIKLLALQPGHRLHRDQLLDLLWPDLAPDPAANQLRKALHVARRALDPEPDAALRFLVRRGEVLMFRPDAVWVDMDAFEREAEQARRQRDVPGYEAAVAAYAGELLPDDRYEEWVLEPRRRLEDEMVDLLVELAAMLEAQGELEHAAGRLESALALRPYDEQATGALMRVQALTGRRTDALRCFDTLRRTLREELGVSPGPSIQRLYEEIRMGETTEPELDVGLWERVGDLRLVAGEMDGAVAAFRSATARAGTSIAATARLRRKTAQALLARHDAAGAMDQLEEAAARTGDDDLEEQVNLEATRAHCLCELGSLDEAVVAADLSLALAAGADDPGLMAIAHEARAIVDHYRGAWREGLLAEINRLKHLDVGPDLGRVYDIHHCIGQYHLYGDHLAGGVEGYARATLQLATEKGARRAEAFAWCLLGESLLLGGRWEEARACLRRSGEIHAELGNTSGALAWQRLAELAACRGGDEDMEGHLDRAVAIATVSPMAHHLWGRIYATAGIDAVERGDAEGAVQAIRSAARAATRHGECPSCAALLHPVAAEAHSMMGNHQAAARHAAAAGRLAESWQSSAWRGMAETAAGFASVAASDPVTARRYFLAAADLFQFGGQPFWTARSLLLAARADPDHPDTDELASRAAATFEELGAVRARDRAGRFLIDRG